MSTKPGAVVLLSGGLDSPAVAAFAAAELGRDGEKPLGALSCVFPDLPSVGAVTNCKSTRASP